MISPPSPASTTDKPARLGRFVVQEEIGRGSIGVVYLAHDPVIDRKVAVKTFRNRLTPLERRQFEQQFVNEARAAGRLSHRNIVTIYEASTEGGTTYIAMEPLQGREISKILEGGHRFSVEDVASICWKIADALDHAHGRGVVHRDIKPANIFLIGPQQPKIMDFGIARTPNRLHEEAMQTDAPNTLFQDNLIGTPNYMSPEQANGHNVDPRTDIYSLGAVMFEMLTASKPFHAADTEKLLQQITARSIPAPHKLSPDIPQALSQIVVKAMQRNPDLRYQTAGDMALEIKRYLRRMRRQQERSLQAERTESPANAPEFQPPRLMLPVLGIVTAACIVIYTLLS